MTPEKLRDNAYALLQEAHDCFRDGCWKRGMESFIAAQEAFLRAAQLEQGENNHVRHEPRPHVPVHRVLLVHP